jgi:hypothetical protein
VVLFHQIFSIRPRFIRIVPNNLHQSYTSPLADNRVPNLCIEMMTSPYEQGEQGCDSEYREESEATDGNYGSSFEPIAIIGFAAKFPEDAADTESFWKMLLERRSALSKVPEERYNAEAFVSSKIKECLRTHRKTAHTCL